MQREDLEIIDGQQRITSLYEYFEGGFSLFDPVKDDQEAKFPRFIRDQPCPWGGKLFSSLPKELQDQFLNTELQTVKVITDNPHDVRDLFVRLQSGLPLNAQEARDAWPGEFAEYVLALGGKPEIARFPGHAFFQGPMGLNPRTDRGKTRQFAAQIAALFISRREYERSHYADISASAINEFYFSHVDFDKNSSESKRLTEILGVLDRLLGSGKRPKLKGHDAIHLILLTDSLLDDYTRSWEAKLPTALDKFMENFALSKNNKDSDSPDEFWTRYGQWTRVNSDRGETISRRHIFYMEKMLEYLGPLQLKDPKRTLGELEREILYFKSRKSCAVCESEVPWNEFEVHHVIEHARGGETNLTNAALVHPTCHPKGEASTKIFEQKFRTAKSNQSKNHNIVHDLDNGGYFWKSREGNLLLPNGTDIRITYKGKDYLAKVDNNQIFYNSRPLSPSSLVNSITGTSRNAWRDIWVRLRGNTEWDLADDLRRDSSLGEVEL
jgi:hypothetical protein